MSALDEAWNGLLESDPDRVLYTELDDACDVKATLTARQLHDSASSIATHLLTRVGAMPGERVALLYPQGIEVVKAFFGCLVAGLIPVPAAPPHPLQPADDLRTFAGVARTAGTKIVLTEGTYRQAKRLGRMKGMLSGTWNAWPSDLTWVRTDKVRVRKARRSMPVHAETDLAYLQFTSGSTSDPKGVRITFGNVSDQMRIMQERGILWPGARGLLWVPYFHDLCLVSGVLPAIFGLGDLMLWSPLAFLKRPERWMEAMSRYRCTHSAAPDFAYRLAARKTPDSLRDTLDLSCVRMLGAGAEPNRLDTIEAFHATFGPAGLSERSTSPSYGMAEHTLLITQSRPDERYCVLHVDRDALERDRHAIPDPDGLPVIANGRLDGLVDVVVVDPETETPVEDDHVGEIWVKSNSVADGYFGHEPNALGFGERLATDPPPSDEAATYLRTGDLGFVHDNRLYITGRLKDLIIIGGRNIYPQDLEVSADVDGLKPGRTVGFGVPGEHDEEVVVAAEVRDARATRAALEALAARVRRRIHEEHQVAVKHIVLMPPNGLPRTSSGKVRRQVARRSWIDHELATNALFCHPHGSQL